MKKNKIILISLEILLIIIILGHNTLGIGQPKDIQSVVERSLGANEYPSLNYTLKYEMPKGYVQDTTSEETSEIAILKLDGTSRFIGNSIPVSEINPDEFISTQNEFFSQNGDSEIIFEDKITKNNRNILKNVSKIITETNSLYLFSSTIEFDNDNQSYMAIVGSAITDGSVSDELLIGEFNTLIDSTDFTGQTIGKERLFSDENSNITITIPANWQHYRKSIPYSFFKSDDLGYMYTYAEGFNKSDIDPTEQFDALNENFKTSFPDATAIQEQATTDFDNKTITNVVYEYHFGDKPVYTHFAIIDFKSSDTFAMISHDLDLNVPFDDVLDEIIKMTNSINLK